MYTRCCRAICKVECGMFCIHGECLSVGYRIIARAESLPFRMNERNSETAGEIRFPDGQVDVPLFGKKQRLSVVFRPYFDRCRIGRMQREGIDSRKHSVERRYGEYYPHRLFCGCRGLRDDRRRYRTPRNGFVDDGIRYDDLLIEWCRHLIK